VKPLLLILPLALAMLTGCSKNIQTDEAVRQGVIKHLSKNTNLSLASMDVTVSAVSFKDNEAEATVSFAPKGGGPASGMQMRYTLEKQGAEWVVKKKADSGAGAGHGQMPGGMPPAGAMPPAGGMPPAGAMPADHPPMGTPKAAEKK